MKWTFSTWVKCSVLEKNDINRTSRPVDFNISRSIHKISWLECQWCTRNNTSYGYADVWATKDSCCLLIKLWDPWNFVYWSWNVKINGSRSSVYIILFKNGTFTSCREGPLQTILIVFEYNIIRFQMLYPIITSFWT